MFSDHTDAKLKKLIFKMFQRFESDADSLKNRVRITWNVEHQTRNLMAETEEVDKQVFNYKIHERLHTITAETFLSDFFFASI